MGFKVFRKGMDKNKNINSYKVVFSIHCCIILHGKCVKRAREKKTLLTNPTLVGWGPRCGNN